MTVEGHRKKKKSLGYGTYFVMARWFVIVLCMTFDGLLSRSHSFFSHKMEIPAHPMGCFKRRGSPVISCLLSPGIPHLSGLAPGCQRPLWCKSQYLLRFPQRTHWHRYLHEQVDFTKAFIRLRSPYYRHNVLKTFHTHFRFPRGCQLSCRVWPGQRCFLRLLPWGTPLPGPSHSLPAELTVTTQNSFPPSITLRPSLRGSETLRDLQKQISNHRQVSLMRNSCLYYKENF